MIIKFPDKGFSARKALHRNIFKPLVSRGAEGSSAEDVHEDRAGLVERARKLATKLKVPFGANLAKPSKPRGSANAPGRPLLDSSGGNGAAPTLPSGGFPGRSPVNSSGSRGAAQAAPPPMAEAIEAAEALLQPSRPAAPVQPSRPPSPLTPLAPAPSVDLAELLHLHLGHEKPAPAQPSRRPSTLKPLAPAPSVDLAELLHLHLGYEREVRRPQAAAAPALHLVEPPPVTVHTSKKHKPTDPRGDKLRFLVTTEGNILSYDKSHVQGGFGRFHRAETVDGEPRGIKQFRLPVGEQDRAPPLKQWSPKSMDRTTKFAAVQNEAALMRELGIQVYGVHRTTDGKAFIETELFAGSVYEKLHRVPIEHRAAVARHSLLAMLQQLTPLHAKGSVHRDIKNENLLFNSEGRVQIADPGLLLSAAEIRALAPDARAKGTSGFMAPEVFAGAKPAAAVDVWAAGAAYLEQLSPHSWPQMRLATHVMADALDDFADVRENYLNGDPMPHTSAHWAEFIESAHRVDPQGTRFAMKYLLQPDPNLRMQASRAAERLAKMQLKRDSGRIVDVPQAAAEGFAAALR